MIHRLVPVVACCLALAAGCAVGPHQDAATTDDAEVPFGLLDPATPTLVPPAPPSPATATLCYFRDDRFVEIDGVPVEPGRLDELIDDLATPPRRPGEPLTTVVDAGAVAGVESAGGVATVDLLPELGGLAVDRQRLVIAQLVCTLTAQRGIGLVSFTLAGSPVDVPRGDGSLSGSPLSRDDFPDLIG